MMVELQGFECISRSREFGILLIINYYSLKLKIFHFIIVLGFSVNK